MAALLHIISRCGLNSDACHINQPTVCNSSKLALYKALKQLYICTKMEHFRYKGGCGMYGRIWIKVLKRRAGLGYR